MLETPTPPLEEIETPPGEGDVPSEIPSEEGMGFPFRPIDSTVTKIFDTLDGEDKEIRLALYDVYFHHLLAANLMFSTGGDAYEPARIAALVNLAGASPEALEKATAIGKRWGYTQEQIESLSRQWQLLEDLLANPQLDVFLVQEYGNDVVSLEAFLVNEIAKIQVGAKVADPVRLEALAKTARLILAGKAEPWPKGQPNRSSVFGSLNNMTTCLEDLTFSVRYPGTFKLENQAGLKATGIAPEMRYNNQALSEFLEQTLVGNHFIDRRFIAEGRVQILGRVKPLASGLSKDLREGSVREEVIRLAKERGLKERDWQKGENLIAALEELLRYQEHDAERGIAHFTQELERRRIKGLDERGGRVLVKDPRDFDQIVFKLHQRMSEIAFGAKIGKALGTPGDKGVQSGYLRGYEYTLSGSVRQEKVYWDNGNWRPAEASLDYVRGTPEGELRYVGYHNLSPAWVTTESGEKKAITLEVQVRLGTKGMEAMRNTSYLIRRYGPVAGVTPLFAIMVRLDAQRETQRLSEEYRKGE